MMPAPFDRLSAIARLQTDSTAALRERHPDLSWVWDELDALRDDAANAEEVLGDLRKKVESAVEILEEITK